MKTGRLKHSLLYQRNQRTHILRRRAAGVDHKARVLFRHTRAAYPNALELCLLNQRAGVSALRALERASCGRKLQRGAFP